MSIYINTHNKWSTIITLSSVYFSSSVMSDQYIIYALYFKVDLVKRKLCTKRPRGGEGEGQHERKTVGERWRERGEEEGNANTTEEGET